MHSYSVLSYIFNGYELLHEVMEPDPEADYIMVTDDPSLRSGTWRIVLDERRGMGVMEKCYDVRFHPFRRKCCTATLSNGTATILTDQSD